MTKREAAVMEVYTGCSLRCSAAIIPFLSGRNSCNA